MVQFTAAPETNNTTGGYHPVYVTAQALRGWEFDDAACYCLDAPEFMAAGSVMRLFPSFTCRDNGWDD